MSEPNGSNEDVLRQLREMQARMVSMSAQQPAPAPVAPMGWSQQPAPVMPQPAVGQAMFQPASQPGIMPQPTGLLVPVSMPTPEGEATCYLQFGPEAAANPQAVVMQLMQAGWPVKAWRQRPPGGGFGGGFNRGGGGGYGGGGGFNRMTGRW